MFSKIWASQLDDYQSATKDDEGQLYIELKRLNLIIGANNTGKSRLLRRFFIANDDEMVFYDHDLLSELLLKKHIFTLLSRVDDQDISDLAAKILSILSFSVYSINYIRRLVTNLNNDLITIIRQRAIPIHDNIDGMWFEGDVEKFYSDEKIQIILNKIKTKPFPPKKYYIPILRGMRPLDERSDVFHQRTIKDYFPVFKNENLNIVTGFALYELLTKLLLGQPEGRARVSAYEAIIGQEFFGGAKITLIPEYGKDTVSVKIGDEKQFPIYDLGDGLQQVIIITSACYLEAETSMFFIEEPENCLHPGLLRKLATFLLEHTKHQYLATTHSNHLLDLAELRDDVAVHRLSKQISDGATTFHIRECTKDRDTLAELGVKASSVYLANCTIWVEGITDRLYLRCFIKKYLDELPDGAEKTRLNGLLENYHYAFIEYQGGTLGHWNFDDDDVDGAEDAGLCAIRACAEALLIADGDIRSKGTREETFRAQLNERLIVLPGKEIENMLPESILKGAARQLFDSKTANKDGLDKAKLEAISWDAYKDSHDGIGFHLDTALGLAGKGKTERKFFADDSGTIKDKVKLCQTAVEKMGSDEWQLTGELKTICEQIFAHITKNNPE